MKTVIENLSIIIGGLLIGWVLGVMSFSQGLWLTGGMLVIIGVLYFMIGKKIPI